LIIEQLQKTGYKKIEAFNTTNDSKQTIINNLRLDLETGKITNCTNNSNLISELIDELISFEFKISTNGNIIYSAPNGLHDDMVMSLALAN
jgi:tricorn protease-like protein